MLLPLQTLTSATTKSRALQLQTKRNIKDIKQQANMQEGDPYRWSSAETVEFLRQNQFASLAQQWSTNDLDGHMLLQFVDLSLLKDEFGIAGINERMVIMKMISALRKSSIAYAETLLPSDLPSSLPLLTPHPSGPQTPTEPIGSRVRKGEELVEDSGGRKRRRLNLDTTFNDTQPGAAQTPIITTPEPTIKAAPTKLLSGFLRDMKLPIDRVFYGDIAYGSEIEHTETEDDDSHDNFTVFGEAEFMGDASFVYRRLQHAFQQTDIQPIKYHEKSALAVYPYPERLLEHKNVRSVTIFEPSENGIKVIREKAQMLPFQQHETVNTQMSPGEFSYLLDRHEGSDEILPAYGESDYGSDSRDEQITEAEGSESGSDDEMAEEDSAVEAPALSDELVLSVIDKIIELQAHAWRADQQPKLDKNKSRSVWRLAKGNMRIARALIKGATQAIERLDARLEQFKKRLMERTWDTEQEVEQACVMLEPTVNDREKEEWKIRIWTLKAEPATIARQSKASDKGRHGASERPLDQDISDGDMQDFVVNDDNFQDARESLSEDDHHSEPDLDMHEPLSQRDARDESVKSGADSHDIAFKADEDMPDVTERPADFEGEIARRSSIGSEPPEPPEPLVGMNQTVESIQTPQKSRLAVGLESGPESPGLPSPRTLFKSRKSTVPKNMTVIEILSSPVRPTAAHATPQKSPFEGLGVKEEQRTQTQITYSADPDNDSIAEIEGWEYESLEEEQDRRRLMLKLVSERHEDQLDSLVRLFSSNMTACLGKIRFAISAANNGEEIFDGYDETNTEAMRYAARLYLCYLYTDHRYFDSDISELASLGHDWPWDDDEQNYADDLRQWHDYTWRALKRFKQAHTIKEPEIVIIDGTDDETNERDQPGHSSTRKRFVKRDQDAVRKRAKAAERAAAYESQNQNSQLGSFMAGEDGEIDVPLYAPDDVDPSKHVYLNPEIAKRLKPHQIEGVKFLWREITTPEDEDGQGCLLAHTMGLGKTAQSLALLTAVAETAKDISKRDALPEDLKKARNKFRALVLCPPSLMANWKQEIAIWCPEKLFHVFSLSSEIAAKALRLDELYSWRKRGGIMLCGYTMFTRLINGQGSKKEAFSDAEQKTVLNILLEKPHIIVADEVHSIKSDSSKVSLAAHKFRTQRRIGLTGSPMSNNTTEIFALIDWVAPKFLGNKVEFKAHYQEPIEAGTYFDSHPSDVRRSMKKLAALKQIIAPKLNRADITVLKGSLKSKVEFVLTIPLTEQQKSGYGAYVKEILRGKAGEEGTTITQAKLFGWLSILQLLCNHPIVFRRKLLEPPSNKKTKKTTLNPAEAEVIASTSTADVVAADSSAPSSTARPARTREGSAGEDDTAYADAHISQYDINKAIVDALLEVVPDDDSIELSYKTLLVRKIMRLSIAAGDKVLIFSQSIPSLNFLDRMLSSIGASYGRIQGDVAQDRRERVLKQMADGKLDVLLISTRAGGLGLNIQQANRVIIFDFAFNPTWEEQAIGRAYRLGQTKPVFVYRFVAGGTFEFALYDKQLFKTGLSSRVVDKKNPQRNANKKPAEWMKPPFDVLQQDISVETGKDEHVMDKIITSQLEGQDEFIRSIKTMETLMGESKDEALTAEEMQEVETEVLRAKTAKIRKPVGDPVPPLPPASGPRPIGAGVGFGIGSDIGAGLGSTLLEPSTMPRSNVATEAQAQPNRQLTAAAAERRLATQTPAAQPTDLTGSPSTPSRMVLRF
jgi:transcriptional regulator ATRX